MSSENEAPRITNPLQVLGLPRHATEQQVRQKYLELVREFPPERDPDRFRQIHAAYKTIEDPLVRAQELLHWDVDGVPRPWSEILNEQRANPPHLSVEVLLSLGNWSSRDKQAAVQPSPVSATAKESTDA